MQEWLDLIFGHFEIKILIYFLKIFTDQSFTFSSVNLRDGNVKIVWINRLIKSEILKKEK
jgi:hypothetical protein